MRNNQPVYDQEYTLHDEQYLISRTDARGRIIYANPAFVEVSGFSREELVGSAHNIVRHPDMPEEAFADLWRTIQRGDSWTGVVRTGARTAAITGCWPTSRPSWSAARPSATPRCASSPRASRSRPPRRFMRGCAAARAAFA